ncbi:hypothetical protein KDA_52740 [Dictyobacter alpinus]|uniref:Uncharacterized protein n=1 Tax=Dictyobacter alpinus TaxID=2014873 RepID=A0A402BER4_9CHLR|nr:hypothetical protein KDA_52740 [Dictyobacter alpinus]
MQKVCASGHERFECDLIPNVGIFRILYPQQFNWQSRNTAWYHAVDHVCSETLENAPLPIATKRSVRNWIDVVNKAPVEKYGDDPEQQSRCNVGERVG